MEENQKSPHQNFFLPLSIVTAAVLISGSIIYSTGLKKIAQTSDLSKGVSTTDTINNSNGDLIDDDAILGDPKAPVTMVEFGDYQCPFCGRFFSRVEPQLKTDYIASGKVKMVYRDFAFLGPESLTAALAAQCAGEQGKYWAYHDKLFQTEIADGAENNGNLTPALMKSLAQELNLNMTQFNSCFDSKKYSQEIEKDYNDGVKAGVSGTPTIFVNGKLISGAQPYSVFQQAIDSILGR